MHSPDPVGFVMCVIWLISIHPQRVRAQPQTGSYIQCDNPCAQTRRAVFPKEGGGRWGSSLLFLQRTGEIGVLLLLPYLEKGQW